MEQVDIRACGVQDIAEVAGLERQWEQEQIAYGDFSPLGREGFLAALERSPAYFLVAERDAQLLGYIRASLHQAAVVPALPAEGACLEIEDLYVRPDVRGEEIGGALLDQLLAVARQAGVRRFVVGTLSTQTDQILRFYRRHGFTPWHIQFFLQDDEPA
jgi:ribosomal protein S18 acetylase RimI-like enzyme